VSVAPTHTKALQWRSKVAECVCGVCWARLSATCACSEFACNVPEYKCTRGCRCIAKLQQALKAAPWGWKHQAFGVNACLPTMLDNHRLASTYAALDCTGMPAR